MSSLVHSVSLQAASVMASAVGEVNQLLATAGRVSEAGLHAVEHVLPDAAAAQGTPAEVKTPQLPISQSETSKFACSEAAETEACDHASSAANARSVANYLVVFHLTLLDNFRFVRLSHTGADNARWMHGRKSSEATGERCRQR